LNKTDKILQTLKSRPQDLTPIATDMFIPNNSGMQAISKTDTVLWIDKLNRRVGIGTITPGAKLDLVGTNHFRVNTEQNVSGDIKAGTTISATLGTNENLNIAPETGGTNNASVTGVAFNGTSWRSMLEYSNVASGEPKLLLVKSGGNVGIGTTTTPSILTVAGLINMKNYTVATLPAGTRGDIAYVTDALAPVYLTAIAGGGAIITPVFYNGTAWVAF
jgi:hypothetical protein